MSRFTARARPSNTCHTSHVTRHTSHVTRHCGRYTLLKGLELSKAAAQGLNKVLGDKHEKSREAKDVYREFLSKKQVLLPASPRVGDVSRAGQIAGSPISSPANSSRN
jgi:hypothetical protein